MSVFRTTAAVEHLLGIYERIERDSGFYARQIIDRLTQRSGQLATFPLSGRLVPEYDYEDLRELIEGPYRLIYRVRPNQIEILALVHGSQQLPPEL